MQAKDIDIWTPEEVNGFQWEGKERCGFVMETPLGQRFLELPNVSTKPDVFFEMKAEHVTHILHIEEWSVLGIWHTHPGGMPEPSTTDWEWAPPQWPFFIVCDGATRKFDTKKVGDREH